MMDYKQTLEYLYSQLPMFQRVGGAAFKKDLTNTVFLCGKLGNPHEQFKTVHVAGTNGKGSTAHAIASVLQSAGYKTGLYTSPHLKSFTERIRVDGVPIREEAVVDFVRQNRSFIEEINPSFFEVTVAMAFDYFAKEKVDLGVIEVGMGGRLDSTNVIHPELSIITNISYDHQAFLGDTLPLIAAEKAGIIKKEVPVVISHYQQEVAQVFIEKAYQCGSRVVFADQEYQVCLSASPPQERVYSSGTEAVFGLSTGSLKVDIKDSAGKVLYKDLEFGLAGHYQLKNIAGIMKAIEILKDKGFWINEEQIREGLAHITGKTGLKGRWQVLKQTPLVICDTGHNEDGIRNIVEQIASVRYTKLYFVLGVVNDKKLDSVLTLLPKDAYYYFTQANIPRALVATELQQQALAYGLQGEVVPEVNEAYAKALQSAGANDLIFIGGSTFTVAELNEI